MKMAYKVFSALVLLSIVWACGKETSVPERSVTAPSPVLTAEEAQAIYDYAYPLVIMKISQDLMFTVPFRPPSHPNQFILFKRLAMPQNRAVVLGNRNTLYSVGWVDLSKGPVLFEIPDMGDRYYVMPLLDAWTNTFASLGSRTTGQGAQKYMLVNQDWQGQAVAGYEVIESPTNMVWITGRIQADSPEDAVAAGVLQDALKLQTLSQANTGVDPFTDFEATYVAGKVMRPVPFSLQMSAQAYYDEFIRMWAANPSPNEDAPMLALLAKAGIQSGTPTTFATLTAEVQALLTQGLKDKQANYQAAFFKGKAQTEAWTFNRERMGTWGTDYARRAYWAMWGLGANLVEDAVYGVSQLDAQLNQLDGAQTYKLHFDAEDMPPTSAFWSLTAYDLDGYLEANEANRYSLGSNHELRYNADGSVDLYLSNKRPKDESRNWVPAPKGQFKVLLRIYWPSEGVLDGAWQIPPLEIVDSDFSS